MYVLESKFTFKSKIGLSDKFVIFLINEQGIRVFSFSVRSIWNRYYHIFFRSHLPDTTNWELSRSISSFKWISDFVLSVNSLIFSVFFNKLVASKLYFFLHCAFPPDEFSLKIGSSNCVLIVPDIISFENIDGLWFSCKRILVISKP